MRLYVIRHADPDYVNKTITEAGHLEAQALAARLSTEGITRIYCSPMGRARDTAKYTADKLGLPVGIEDWTQELADLYVPGTDGQRGFCAWDVHGEDVRSLSPLPTHENWGSLPEFERLPVSEVFQMVRSNSDEFIARHGYVRENGVYRIEQPNRERIAVFCHGGFGLTWLAHLLEVPLPLMWTSFFLPTSSVTRILFEERSDEYAVPRCFGLGDISHLRMARLPMQSSGLQANVD